MVIAAVMDATRLKPLMGGSICVALLQKLLDVLAATVAELKRDRIELLCALD
jgi:hypothetical protein